MREGYTIRQYCMERGTLVGITTSMSFLASMYGLNNIPVGHISNLLALLAWAIAIFSIRRWRLQVEPSLTFGHTWRMVLGIYFYAILLTAAVQYTYFAFLDHGRLAMQMEQLLAIPEYHQMLEQMFDSEDTQTIVQQVLTVFRIPAKATMQMLWMNTLLAFILTIPTTLLGLIGKKTMHNK